MEYNRQVPVGGAQGAEAAKARGVNADQRDMAFATVTIAEKDGSGQARNSNVSQPVMLACRLCLTNVAVDRHATVM